MGTVLALLYESTPAGPVPTPLLKFRRLQSSVDVGVETVELLFRCWETVLALFDEAEED